MAEERPRYVAYMLRLWQVPGPDGPVWHASLESPRTGEVRVFTQLQKLVSFLDDVTANENSSHRVATPKE